ncbi:putative transmembrane protein [Toxoplasma gondii VEG]|uniref:Transmembrane protein n=3 Tax=Toxoplasma gondii TaxID=5811 RepID=V4ZMD1_TOXGV|nr:putative transmembrane protein [Toxoplasma gondii VEG]KFG52223.1 putative transmembrane protein [Toxoplasma gondii p89]PUA87850.1 putative transmembrane protein [Toxoplasma gondii TgCATBr9]
MALPTSLSASVQWTARTPQRRKRVRRSCFCCVFLLLFNNAFGTGFCVTRMANPQTCFIGSIPEVSSPLVSESFVPFLCIPSSSARRSLDPRCEGCLPTPLFLPAFAVPSPPGAARLDAARQALVNLNTEARGVCLLSSPVQRSAEVRHHTAFASPSTPTLHGCRASSRMSSWAHAGKTCLSDPSNRGSFSRRKTSSCLGSVGSQGSPSSPADWDKTLFTTHVRPAATTRGTRLGTRSQAISTSAVASSNAAFASSPVPHEKEDENPLRETPQESACGEVKVNGEGRADAVGREGRRRSLLEMRCDGAPYVGLVTQILPPPLSAGRQLWPLAVVDIGCMRSGTLELRPHWDIRVGDLVPVKVASVDLVCHRLVLQLDSSAKERFFQKFRGPNTWLKGELTGSTSEASRVAAIGEGARAHWGRNSGVPCDVRS